MARREDVGKRLNLRWTANQVSKPGTGEATASEGQHKIRQEIKMIRMVEEAAKLVQIERVKASGKDTISRETLGKVGDGVSFVKTDRTGFKSGVADALEVR